MHAKHEENWCPGRHSHAAAAAAESRCSCRVSMKVQAKIRKLVRQRPIAQSVGQPPPSQRWDMGLNPVAAEVHYLSSIRELHWW